MEATSHPSRAQPEQRKLRHWREFAAWFLWHAHPARPGPQYKRLKESQWWPRERIEEQQVEGLRRIVEVARQVPFYRDRFAAAGVDAEALRTVDDVRTLPILERTDLGSLGVEGIKVPGSWVMQASTSGSTGSPVRF
ncbi:MAG: hypothetical protein KJO11_12860, partial [Gemmatimonadetes bacterium]|nr:hypothetical protein [Gemmatimonadota bacterium]